MPSLRGTVAAPDFEAPATLREIGNAAKYQAEAAAIESALTDVHWNRAKAARLLGISYKALLYKITQYRLG